MKNLFISCALVWAALGAISQPTKSFDLAYHFLSSGNAVQDKNFYFLTLLEQISTSLAHEPLNKNYIDDFIKHVGSCQDVACIYNSLLWTDEKNKDVHKALIALYHTDEKIKKLLNQARQSGNFILYDDDNDTTLIQNIWDDCAKGMNHIIRAYAFGEDLRYPNIDSATYPVKGKFYQGLLHEAAEQLRLYQSGTMKLFFEPSLKAALTLLEMNNRDEAARYEPLSSVNREAINQIAKTNWAKYSYSAILVLGEGPEYDHIPISPYGKLRCRTAAAVYFSGKAPFIIVSGGHVHPFQTAYSEAIEMKRYLINVCHVPANAIIAEPYARHTTTNLRNANRLILRNGVPLDKKILAISSETHLDYIFNEKFSQRCMAEINHLPYEKIRRLSEFEFEYFPVRASLQINSLDPIDP